MHADFIFVLKIGRRIDRLQFSNLESSRGLWGRGKTFLRQRPGKQVAGLEGWRHDVFQ
jgi:hypothetical protein